MMATFFWPPPVVYTYTQDRWEQGMYGVGEGGGNVGGKRGN